MTGLWIACALLVALSAAFILFPRVRSGGTDEDLERANLEWLRLREQELQEEGAQDLAGDARLRLLEDAQGAAAVAAADVDTQRRVPGWLLLVLVGVFSGLLYYRLGAAPDVLISEQLRSLDAQSTPAEMEALMLAIEQRAGQRPDNPHYTALLGRYYMGQQDYARAAETYEELAEIAPEDAQALAYAAQARYLAAGRSLSDAARMRAEQALAIDPHQRTALGLLGMASYEQGQFRAAIEYWQRLVAMEPPGSETANMINGIIEQARAKLGEAPMVASPAGADATGVGVSVTVSLPEGAVVAPGDTVFVLARNAASDSRMPIAVQRLQGRQLPLQLRLDDSNSMAGQKLSDVASVMVVVQVSPEGRPGEANATWTGQAGPVEPSAAGEPVEIVLQPRAG
jgi:cytochrome c-type biogenesis protein CcmH